MSLPEPVLLCVGDIHLGRRASRVPKALLAYAGRAADPGPRRAWEAVVEEARRRRVAAVVLLGDVVDSEDHYLEAFGALVSGVRALVEAGIEVLAIAGNHDVRALPQLAAEVPGFRLLGRGGEWEEHVLAHAGRPLARLVGWSFPQARVTSDPLQTLRIAARADVPTIGLLHCDLDKPGSPHAPVRRAALEATGFAAWLLGHIHAPSVRPTERPVGYLGSLQGLDPSERGVHGPWLLHVRGPARVELEQLALAPLRWEELELDVSGIASARELDVALGARLRRFHDEHAQELARVEAVGCRVRLVGRSPAHRELAAAARAWSPEERCTALEGRGYFIDALIDAAGPQLDLEALARDDDPPGLLARQLLCLRGPGDAGGRAALLKAARRELAAVAEAPAWAALARERGERRERPALDDEACAAHLERAGLQALEELLAQKERA